VASYACPRCGTIGDAQPCAACGAAAFDLATETEALRFSLARRMRLRAGIGAGIGCVIGFVHSAWLQGDTHDRYYAVQIAWVFALAAIGAMVRPRAIAELEAQVGRGKIHRGNLITFALCAVVIVAETAIVWRAAATTMPKKDGERLVVDRMCELAATCSKGVFCMGHQLDVDLQIGHARVDKSDVDDCLRALDELKARHEVCGPARIPACEAVTNVTIPQVLDETHHMNREIDRAIDKEIQKSLDRLPPPR